MLTLFATPQNLDTPPLSASVPFPIPHPVRPSPPRTPLGADMVFLGIFGLEENRVCHLRIMTRKTPPTNHLNITQSVRRRSWCYRSVVINHASGVPETAEDRGDSRERVNRPTPRSAVPGAKFTRPTQRRTRRGDQRTKGRSRAAAWVCRNGD